MRLSNYFDIHPLTDTAAPGSAFVSDHVHLTIYTTGADVDALADVLNVEVSADHGPRLAELAAARTGALAERTPARSTGVFRIALPARTSFDERLAAELAAEVIAAWPELTMLVLATPNSVTRAHQVLLVHDGGHAYSDLRADAPDTLVSVGTSDSVWGVLTADGWRDASDSLSLERLGDFLYDYLGGFHSTGVRRAVFYACLDDDGDALEHVFADTCPELACVGPHLWAASGI